MQKKINTRYLKILFLITIIALSAFLLATNRSVWSGTYSQGEDGQIDYVENSWVFKHGDVVIDDDIKLPEFTKLERGEKYSVSTILTYDGSKDDLPYGFLHMDHVYCRILLEGEELFSYMPEDLDKWDASNSPGFIYTSFPLPKDSMGKELTIELLPMLNTDVEYGLPDVKFGDFVTTLHNTYNQDLLNNIVVILCFLIGLASLSFSTFTLHGSNYREGICIGIFSILFSIYLFTECEVNAYYIANPYYFYLLNYTVFSLLPISLMGFMRERLSSEQSKICSYIINVELVLFVIEIILHLTGVYDMRDLIPIIHFIYFAEISLIIIFILKMRDKQRKIALVMQLVPIIVGMIVDAIIYWNHWGFGTNDATFTILGVMVFMLVEIFHVWETSIGIYTESVRSKLYRELAYVDELTSIGNRRAYDKEIEDIIKRNVSYQTMLVISADVNKLKYVNDNFGHAEGDKLISTAAHIMVKAVDGRGKVFRTGGDEFSIFLYDTTMEDYETMLVTADRDVQEFNANNAFRMSIAVGCVEITDNNILDAVRKADQRMYDNKLERGK